MHYKRLAIFLVISVGLIALSMLFQELDFGWVQRAAIALISALALFAWALHSAPHQRPTLWLSLIAYLALSLLLLKHYSFARDEIRWALLSRTYKARVAAQPAPARGELKHVEWDGWGFAGIDTTVYLAFDPTDSLPAQAGRSSNRERGLPCPVWRVRRLDRGWYAITFYSDTWWGERSCT